MRLLSLWLPVLLWAALIFHLSGVPQLRITEAWWDLIARKIAHMVVYGILAVLLTRAVSGTSTWPWRRVAVVSFLVAIAYAASDEYHQTFVAGRAGSIRDVLIDAVGAWLALAYVSRLNARSIIAAWAGRRVAR
jgi:VanZ family protein